jgi:hypothetical protein
MSNKADPEPIETNQLDDITGGCGIARGGCVGGCTGLGGVAYTRSTGFGIDPLFMLFAMTLFSQNNNK